MTLFKRNVDTSRFSIPAALNLMSSSEKSSFTDYWYGAVTDYNLLANTKLFNDIEVAKAVQIYSSEEIQIKFNSTANDARTVQADALTTIPWLLITNIYLTTTTPTNVKILVSGLQRATSLTNSYTSPYFYADATSALNDNMLAYWNLNGDSTDSVQSHDGTDTDVSYVSGKFGNCGSFNGSTSLVTIPSHGDFNDMSALSISLWMNSNDYSGDLGIIYHAKKCFVISNSLLVGGLHFYVSGFTGLTRSATYTEDLTTGQWYHIVGTWSTSSPVKLYVNGILVSSATSLVSRMLGSQDEVSIGAETNGDGPVDGLIDDVGIWDRELTANEIEFLYETGNPIIGG